ncbi:hypothetical protein [Schlesneria paludicola]|uniref:hypothetical protein n=1 Tax=Schlesneria paludicola TaxID=360056 RepID=UPI00029B2E50|nr:hypothetical protein [Schlesneria paludicola]
MRRFAKMLCGALMGVGLLAIPNLAQSASTEDNIRAIKSVDKDGKNHADAIRAAKELSQAPATTLPTLLKSFQGANPLAVNWLRGVIDTIADHELKKTGKLPAAALEELVKDTAQAPDARRLAYEWLVKVDASASDRLIPGMLHDACPEFRRDAIDRLIAQATKAHEANEKPAEIALLKEALSGASDDDQVKAIVKPLRELGETIDLQKHFGFLTEWHLIGPFDNVGLKGFDTVYPPEKERDLKAKYPGKSGDVEWQPFATDDEYGTFDIAKKTAPHKGAVTYATTTFVADKAREIELRLGTPNAWKLWVNGELIFARDEYHRGTFLDQYKVTARLKPGPNVILLKICQNEQTEEWAQAWTFQMRACDHSGIAVPPATTTTSSTK